MTNIKKLGLTALAGSMVATAATAGEVTASGSWGLSYTSEDSDKVNGQAFTMGNSVTFAGSGELDNGWTASVSYELDDGVSDVFDDQTLTLDMGDAGVFKYGENTSGSGIDIASNVVPSVDTPIYSSVGTDTVAYGVSRSAVETGNLGYTLTLDGGLKVSAEMARNTTSGGSDATFGATYTGVDGLTLAVGAGETATGGTAGIDTVTYGAKYAWSGFSVGLQITDVDTAGTTANEEGTHMGITYNVNDDVSIGYSRQETDFSGTKSDEEHSGFQASYSMGSISFSGRVGKVDNMGGTAGSSDSDKHVTMSIAF
jgi:outer membrane protein OmpU